MATPGSGTGVLDSRRKTRAAPDGASFARPDYDAVRSEVVLFGGDTGSGAVGDTWRGTARCATQRAHLARHHRRRQHSSSTERSHSCTAGYLPDRPNANVFAGQTGSGAAHTGRSARTSDQAPVVNRDGFRQRKGLRRSLRRGIGRPVEPNGLGPSAGRHVGGAGLRTACPGDRADGQPRDRRGRRRDHNRGGSLPACSRRWSRCDRDRSGRSRRAERRRSRRRDLGDRDLPGSGRHSTGRRDAHRSAGRQLPDGDAPRHRRGRRRDDGSAHDHPVDDSEQLPGSEPRLPGRPHGPRTAGRRHRGSHVSGRRHRHDPDSPMARHPG